MFPLSRYVREYEITNWYNQLYLGARWCPLFAMLGIYVGLDSNARIDCQVLIRFAFSLSFIEIDNETELIHRLMSSLSWWDHGTFPRRHFNILGHVDICTSLICLRVSSDHPAYVSRGPFLFSLNLTAKMLLVQRYGGLTRLSYQSHRPRGSQVQVPRSIVC